MIPPEPLPAVDWDSYLKRGLSRRLVSNMTGLDRRLRICLFKHQDVSVGERLEHRLGSVADYVILGGMPRDVALCGAAAFRSDIDVVTQFRVGSIREWFQDHLADHPDARKNSFGGFRIPFKEGPAPWLDLWELSDTTAFCGIKKDRSFDDLTATTFFDWDAICWNPKTGQFHAIDGWLERLQSGVIDINLEMNLFPLRCTMKALRWVVSERAKLSPRLAYYCLFHLLHSTTISVGGCTQWNGLDAEQSRALNLYLFLSCSAPLQRYIAAGGAEPFCLKEWKRDDDGMDLQC